MKLFLILAFAISCISFSDACSCASAPGWELERYCESTFAGTFKVVGPQYNCGMMKVCYPITIVQQFRGDPVSIFEVETNSDSAACGVTLNDGDTYFVATTPANGKLGIYMCGLLRNWTKKTCCEMIAEAKNYNCKNYKPRNQIDPIEVTVGNAI